MSGIVLVSFLLAVRKYREEQLKEGTHRLRVESSMAGKTWWRECEAAGHIADDWNNIK